MNNEDIWEESSPQPTKETNDTVKDSFRKKGSNAFFVAGAIIIVLSLGGALYANATANKRVDGNPLIVPIVGFVIGLSLLGFGFSKSGTTYEISFKENMQKLDIQIKSGNGCKELTGVSDFKFITSLYENYARVDMRLVVYHNDKIYAFTETVATPGDSPFPASYEYLVFDDEFVPMEKGFLVSLASSLHLG